MTLPPRPRGRTAAIAAVASSALVIGLVACGDDEPLSDAADDLAGSTTATTAPGTGEEAGGPGAQGGGGGTAGEGLGGAVAPGQESSAGTALRDENGAVMGTVLFEAVEQGTRVTVEVVRAGEANAFHGFHVHANDDPANGEGCLASPSEPRDTWFASADGHLVAEGEDATHGGHQGDMPPLFTVEGGQAAAQFVTDRFSVQDLIDRAVVLHAGPDNLGNVPVGDAPDEYTPNGMTAVDLTQRTGNAGDRIGCGVVETGAGAAGDPAR